MPDWPWFEWILFSLLFFFVFTIALDRLCRHRFGGLRIHGGMRTATQLGKARAAFLFVVNGALVGTALFLAATLTRHGYGYLVSRPIQGIAGVARVLAEVFLMFIVMDTYFYWLHRLFHANKRIYRAMHSTHHSARFPDAWWASYHHPIDYLVSVVAPMCWVVFLPVSPSVTSYFIAMVIANFINIAGHLGYEISGTIVGIPTFNGLATLVDPSRRWIARSVSNVLHHDLHHQTFTRNFGLYFTFWDRVCGTLHPDTDHVERHLGDRPLATAGKARAAGSAEGLSNVAGGWSDKRNA
jgi:sterol desaturase/sphingolipid hydroxylase (fatty acid hydroxylase superfamily)